MHSKQHAVLPALCGLSESEYEDAYRDYGDYVRRVLWARGCPTDLLDDMQSEVWLKVLEQRHDYDPSRGSIATFLSFTAKIMMSNYWRSLDKEPTVTRLKDDASACGPGASEDELPSTPSDASLSDLRSDLAKVLTPLDVQLIPLLEEGLTASEIALLLGLKVKTIKNRLYALRCRLKKYHSQPPVISSR